MTWSAWHAADRAMVALEKARKRIALDLESIEISQDACYRKILNSRADWKSKVDTFLNLRGISKTARGWEIACGSDRGLWKRTKVMAERHWPRFWAILLQSRKERGEE